MGIHLPAGRWLNRLLATIVLLGLAGSQTAASIDCVPDLTFTQVPPYGSQDNLRGQASCVDPATHGLVVYINVGESWWVKPSFAQPVTPIQSDGSWQTDVTTGGIDNLANMIVAFLIPDSYDPPLLGGSAALPQELYSHSLAYESVLRFSGYRWTVKQSAEAVGPGPNYFSAHTDDVFIDKNGRLHLRIVERDGRWFSTEVYTREALGMGSYVWHTTGPIDQLDPNVVLGLFTWDNDAPAAHYREIDIEFARWGNAADATNAQFVVQPWDIPGHLVRFTGVYPEDKGTHAFSWHDHIIHFTSARGHVALAEATDFVATWTYNQAAGIPPDGPANARINLWLYQGMSPTDDQPVAVVVDGFEFRPWQLHYLPLVTANP